MDIKEVEQEIKKLTQEYQTLEQNIITCFRERLDNHTEHLGISQNSQPEKLPKMVNHKATNVHRTIYSFPIQDYKISCTKYPKPIKYDGFVEIGKQQTLSLTAEDAKYFFQKMEAAYDLDQKYSQRNGKQKQVDTLKEILQKLTKP